MPAEIQKRYTAVITEYSRRFGKLLDGWWFDGGFAGMDHKLWLRAARTGNPRRAVTFNDGSFCLGSSKVVDDLETVVRDFKAVGGGVTFNVGIFQEGGLGPDTVSQLAELATRLR